ncbi:MAG: GTPase HflX [Bacteroidia bacterium]|nr:GTPase HflX [Bacteroidia bacterium]
MGVCSRGMSFAQSQEYLDELAFLTETAGARAIRSFIQRLDHPLAATYIGPGKLEEVRRALEESGATMVIFDDDLTPTQIRNLDRELQVKVLDRSSLILYIFSERARSAQARAQVDLAQYQYLLPRLTGMWEHLSRQRGGVGLKGAGEKEIETDRRIIRHRIDVLKKQLAQIEVQENNRRQNRSDFVRVALVGYTNVGKSTIMNLLSKADVLAENKLFATLDTTVRKVTVEGIPFLLSDTVGFIRKLPHHLIESFKSTLAEARESDILLHVVDASNPAFEAHMENVQETLRGLGIQDRTILTVFNKADRLDPEDREKLEASWYARAHTPAICLSAIEKWNLDKFRQRLREMILEKYQEKYPGGVHPLLNLHVYYQDPYAESVDPPSA